MNCGFSSSSAHQKLSIQSYRLRATEQKARCDTGPKRMAYLRCVLCISHGCWFVGCHSHHSQVLRSRCPVQLVVTENYWRPSRSSDVGSVLGPPRNQLTTDCAAGRMPSNTVG